MKGGKKAGLTQGGKRRGVGESTDFCESQTALHLDPQLWKRQLDPREGWWVMGMKILMTFPQGTEATETLHGHVHRQEKKMP